MGQCAGLVSTNDVGTAERFNRGELFHQGVAFCHALGRHGEGKRDGWFEAFGDESDHHAEGENKAFDPTDISQKFRQREENDAHAYCQDRHDLGNTLHFFLQRAKVVTDFLRQFGNSSKSRVHAGGVDDGFA